MSLLNVRPPFQAWRSGTVTNTGTMWQLVTGSRKNKHTSLGNHTGATQMLLGITLVYKMSGPWLISNILKPLALTWNLTLEIYCVQKTDLNALMQSYEGLQYRNSSRYMVQFRKGRRIQLWINYCEVLHFSPTLPAVMQVGWVWIYAHCITDTT